MAVWKIAPGNHAESWQLFSSHDCIGIGWLDGDDFRRYDNVSEVLEALEKFHGKGVEGCGSGAASMIYRFVHEMRIGDILVANNGHNRAVGIGVIESGYIPPDDPDNPLIDEDSTHRHHTRLVNWVVKKEVSVPSGQFLVQQTLAKLSDEKVGIVKQSYLNSYPNDVELYNQLEELFENASDAEAGTPKAVDIGNPSPSRVPTTVYRILRDSRVARRVKELHNNECQICEHTITLADGRRYSEAHHIQPLGGEHIGEDVPSNVICLCPNHHVECDYGIRKLSLDSLRLVDEHEVDQKFIDYHNQNIYGN